MNEIKPLTSIRGLFALYVAIYHIFPRTNAFLSNGYLSVDLFFVLSGFIMSYVYKVKFSSTINIKTYLTYLNGRFARVYPLYAFMIILTTFFYFKNKIPLPNTTEYIILFSFLQSIMDVTNNLIPHAWSISVEFIAYLTFPFAIFLLSKKHGIISLVVITASAFTGLYLASLKGYWGPLDVVGGKFAIVRCLSDYVLGIVSLFVFQMVKEKFKWITLEIALIFSIALAFTTLNFRGYDLLVVVFFTIMIPLLSASQGIIYKLMSLSPIVYLGEISYSIYLIHYPLCRRLSFIPAWFHNKLPFIDFNYIALIITISISILTYHFIEVPFRKFIRGSPKRTNVRV
ncbi:MULTISPECIES: acyltransferase [unclassified Pantoea]|uniref:acyltransferase family protein n=1 Tax=unclassified Pantoea TaxID=2630326 RepID=UPI0001E0F7EB|nr:MULTISPECIES: acyltransferase [unclassified Pantoea]EFM17927.1 acyltransferase 3 [Pantoea sp. aB]QNQ60180.1 acyltransferase [Pantoea sp. MT58]